MVIPTLNEARHLAGLLDLVLAEAPEVGARIVVADGGSRDGTVEIARDYASRHPRVSYLHNARRIQSAGINAAVREFGDGAEYLIRIDAHGTYPADFCRRLVDDARRTGAAAVVVPLTTIGTGAFQSAVATAQNSFVGTGGSEHRTTSGGAWVEHGHHALMRLDAFRAVGGYDESFQSNEDAELDYRLVEAGHRIWLSGSTGMIYFPRSSPAGLFRQYFAYGRGRARNILKHRMVPRPRQVLPLVIAPSVALAALAEIHWTALLPLALWSAATLSFGAWAVARQVDRHGRAVVAAPLVGLAAMIMHFAWSSGFWLHLVESMGRRA